MQTTIAFPFSILFRFWKWSSSVLAKSSTRPVVPAASAMAAQRARARCVAANLFGDFLQFRVNVFVRQFQLDKPWLVIDRHSRMIFLRLHHVITVNDVAKDRLGIGLRETDRRAGEADERSIRQGF